MQISARGISLVNNGTRPNVEGAARKVASLYAVTTGRKKTPWGMALPKKGRTLFARGRTDKRQPQCDALMQGNRG